MHEFFQDLYFWSIFISYVIFLLIIGGSMIVGLLTQVPFVPTSQKVVEKLVECANLKDGQTVYDLGCGDFRIILEAEKHKKIKGIGYEISPIPYILGIIRKKRAKSKSKILANNFFNKSLKDADVIFTYLMPEVMPRLAKKLKKECKKGTKIISNTFKVADLVPSKIYQKDADHGIPTIYVYTL